MMMGRDTEKKLRRTSPLGGREGGGEALITFKILGVVKTFFLWGKNDCTVTDFKSLLQNKIKISLEQEFPSQHVKIKDFLNLNRTFGCLNYEFSITQSTKSVRTLRREFRLLYGLWINCAHGACRTYVSLFTSPRKSIIFSFNFMLRENNTKI